MATVTINIPTAKVQEVKDALARRITATDITQGDSDAVQIEKMLKALIRSLVLEYRHSNAIQNIQAPTNAELFL